VTLNLFLDTGAFYVLVSGTIVSQNVPD